MTFEHVLWCFTYLACGSIVVFVLRFPLWRGSFWGVDNETESTLMLLFWPLLGALAVISGIARLVTMLADAAFAGITARQEARRKAEREAARAALEVEWERRRLLWDLLEPPEEKPPSGN